MRRIRCTMWPQPNTHLVAPDGCTGRYMALCSLAQTYSTISRTVIRLKIVREQIRLHTHAILKGRNQLDCTDAPGLCPSHNLSQRCLGANLACLMPKRGGKGAQQPNSNLFLRCAREQQANEPKVLSHVGPHGRGLSVKLAVRLIDQATSG